MNLIVKILVHLIRSKVFATSSTTTTTPLGLKPDGNKMEMRLRKRKIFNLD
jgi:hypothetical protein